VSASPLVTCSLSLSGHRRYRERLARNQQTTFWQRDARIYDKPPPRSSRPLCRRSQAASASYAFAISPNLARLERKLSNPRRSPRDDVLGSLSELRPSTPKYGIPVKERINQKRMRHFFLLAPAATIKGDQAAPPTSIARPVPDHSEPTARALSPVPQQRSDAPPWSHQDRPWWPPS
jgi:hypothetical protein